jgi:signal transduction histidine kinase
MSLTPLSQVLQEKIRNYLLMTGQSLERLAKQADVGISTLRRLSKGEGHAKQSFTFAFRILTYIAPDEAGGLLEQYYPVHMYDYSRKLTALATKTQHKEGIKKDSKILLKIFQTVDHYRLYGWILAGISREQIFEKFGVEGVSILEEFIAAQVAEVLDDGSVRAIVEETVVLSYGDLKRQAELHVELVDTNLCRAWIWTRMMNLSAQAVEEVRVILYEARRRAWEIMADKSNNGPVPMHFTLIADTLDVDQKTDQTFETRVNNFKKAYDLDQATAQKVAMVAHDLRGPLGYIQNYMDSLSAKNRSEEEFHLARSAMKRINSMLNSFKDLNGEAVVVRAKEWLYLDECKELAESYSHQFKKEFTFIGSLEFDADVDAEKVDRALQNLITNAFEAARTEVRVEVFRQNSELIMIVSDDGPGVMEENVPRLFKKGFTEGKENGTGLGLAFVKHVADGHGGSIEYARSADGWTQFKLTIPHAFFDDMLESEGSDADSFLETEESEEEALRRPLKNTEDPDRKRRLAEIVNQKPIFLVLLDWVHWTSEKHQTLARLLPDYEVSDNYEDVERAWFICLDSDDPYYDYIMAHRLNAVWMPDALTRSSPLLVEILRGMGQHELKKFQNMKRA